MTVDSLLNTSVSDAHINLKNLLDLNPIEALNMVAGIYAEIDGVDNRRTLRKVCATIGRAAIKMLSEEAA